MQRRTALTVLGSALGGATLAGGAAIWLKDRFSVSPLQRAESVPQGAGFGPEALATGPSAVVLGNPVGDVTIVEFFDYQCPYCRRAHLDTETLVAQDPKLRLVHKHWPVLGAVSSYAARLALAARWQAGRYVPVHDALMRLTGQLNEARIRDAAEQAGMNMATLERDLETRAPELDAALGEATAQARMLRFQGTPSFVIGNYLFPGVLDLAVMRKAVAQLRSKG